MKYTIVYDRLDIIYQSNETDIVIPMDSPVEICLNTSKVNPAFEKSYSCKINGEDFCTMLIGHTGKYRYKISRPVKLLINGPALYQENLRENLILLSKELNLTFYKFTHVDIAVDGKGFVKNHDRLRRNKKWKRKQKITTPISQTTYDDTNEIVGNRLGSSSSDKHFSIYVKEKQVDEQGLTHIREFWNKNNLISEVGNPICRIEVRIKKSFTTLLNQNYDKFDKPDFMAALFKKLSADWITFIHADSKEVACLINWKKFKMAKLVGVKKTSTPLSDSNKMKPVVKKLYYEWRITQSDYFRQAIDSLIEKYGLALWYNNHEAEWIKLFEKIVLIKLKR